MSAWRATPGRCSKCHDPILWVQMAEKADGSPGGKMPVDRAWAYSDGDTTLVVADKDGYGHVVVKAAEGMRGRVSHFATCKYAEYFRRRSKAKKEEKQAQQSLF